VLFGELALAAEVLECALEFVCKCLKHGRIFRGDEGVKRGCLTLD